MLDDCFKQYRWNKIREKLGLSDFKFHDLRKTFGSVLAQNGVSTAVIQRLLEHSSADLTNKVYTNVDPVLRQAVDKMPAGDWLEYHFLPVPRTQSYLICQVPLSVPGLWTVRIRTVGYLPVGNQDIEVVSRDTILVLALRQMVKVGTNQVDTIECPILNVGERFVPGGDQDIQVVG